MFSIGLTTKSQMTNACCTFFGGFLAFYTHTHTQPIQLIIYNQFYNRIFIIVIFYKVTLNTELANINHGPWGNTGLGSCENLVITCSSTNHFINLFYMFLFKDTLIYSVDSLTLTHSQHLCKLCLQEVYLTHIFSP